MKYFSIEELSKSDVARKKGIANLPAGEARENLVALVDNILDPLREAWGKPIVVNSGYRSEELNDLVGGSSTSQHLRGQAADIEAVSRSREDNERLFNLIRSLGLPFDQLIDEFGYDWIHVSYDPSRNRRAVIEAARVKGRTVYLPRR